ncbi:ATP-binding protein [Nocardiopsis lambiniae]|uniref:AAA family ATPase n=1 Tax=Nocardiopsis lambiniae TaxID=3075539 RepID=A0ABU2MH98_9ACTN|nr:AAA family ATPase [Nocardiopsis sp. DSM 44743]MDT0332071.1 AAA family ATPase [Nocardiopsis sp. DSM 44743]
MSAPDPRLVASMNAAVTASPDDPVLRLHLAELLLEAGDRPTAISHVAVALQQDPSSPTAGALMARALGAPAPASPDSPAGAATGTPPQDRPAAGAPVSPPAPRTPSGPHDVPPAPAPGTTGDGTPDAASGGDGPGRPGGTPSRDEFPRSRDGHDDAGPMRPEDYGFTSSDITLDDVAGMHGVKERLEAAFLAPLRNAELREAFGKSLRGGLLLYGPPGCGKTFLARGVAGEMGADFLTVSLADILDRWMGNSERNIHALFRRAREYSPCVLFLDELDALGGRRTKVGPHMRNVVTQLLTELDSVVGDNEGVFLLAATNHPWDIDPALRRPGRLDRMLFVPPPDEAARVAILASGLRDRPVEGVDIAGVARRTEGLSGADLSHLCDSAAERALLASARLGRVRPIGQPDVEHALTEVRPSTGDWFESARTAVEFAGHDDDYRELAEYLGRRRRFGRR